MASLQVTYIINGEISKKVYIGFWLPNRSWKIKAISLLWKDSLLFLFTSFIVSTQHMKKF